MSAAASIIATQTVREGEQRGVESPVLNSSYLLLIFQTNLEPHKQTNTKTLSHSVPTLTLKLTHSHHQSNLSECEIVSARFTDNLSGNQFNGHSDRVAAEVRGNEKRALRRELHPHLPDKRDTAARQRQELE